MPRLRHLSGAIVAALVFSTAANATDFNKVVVFGDSLSDNGNLSLALSPTTTPTRFTTNPGTVAVENIASGYGITLAPSLAGGTDLAWGGAGVLNNSPGTPSSVPTISAQVAGYLANGPADPHALYTMWGGANDIFYHATMVAMSGETSTQAQTNIAVAANTEVGLLTQLQAAGAKNIVVFNLPDIGKTPDAAAQEAMAPGSAAALTGLSLIYNGQLNAGLGKLKTNIIPVNVYGLLNEIIANPSQYGFTNVTDPACGAGSSSLQCGPAGSGLPYTYADGTNQTYLFADGVHPTTATHAMLAEVVLAEMAAPAQASLLSEAPVASANAQTRVLDRQMSADRAGAGSHVFTDVSYNRQTFDMSSGAPKTTSNNANLTVGFNGAAGDNVAVGVAFGAGHATADVAGNHGGYKMTTLTTTGYAMYHRGGGYLGGYVGYGQVSFTDVHRRFAIGPAMRTESGKTEGSQLLGALTGGYDFKFDSLRTGPFAKLEWQRVRINGYNETSGDSTAMWFGRQEHKTAVGSIGWRIDGSFQAGSRSLQPYAEVAWHHDSRADPIAVTAGLTTMNGQFTFDGFTPDKSWATASVGLTAKLGDRVSGWVGYDGRFGDNSQKLNSVNLGLRVSL
jgi:outer membrane lipase/esterase